MNRLSAIILGVIFSLGLGFGAERVVICEESYATW